MVERVRAGTANLVLAGLIALAGVVLFVVTVRSGRGDSALLFVGLPIAVAAGLALTPGRSTHGRVFRLTTIGLLLAAVALHEGAICVVLAAPLVYAVAHGTAALVRAVRTAEHRLRVLLPLPLLLAGMEGVQPEWRVQPDESVEVSRVVTADPATVAGRVAAGPQPVAVRPLALRLLAVPTPEHVHGSGLAAGDRWMFGYHGSAHGPGGQIVTEVRESGPHEVTFTVLEDSSITGRWVRMRAATLSWRPAGAQQTGVMPQTGAAPQTEVTLRIDYRRGLDPSWYFGPLQDRFMHAGAAHMLDMLTLR